MKNRLMTVIVTMVITIGLIALAVYFFFGFNNKPGDALSVNSPDGLFRANVVDNPSLDPPEQSVFISRTESNEFRLVDDLPGDIDWVKQISWSPDSRIAVFQTNWYLIITDVYKFNIKKISLNPDWWKWNKNGRTFFSSERTVRMDEFQFINSDTLSYRTDDMDRALRICIAEI
jgi:hypothetical protein